MRQTIFKYPIRATGYADVQMPEGAKLLNVGMQQRAPHVWALVDPDAPKHTRRFLTIGTGWDMDAAEGRYVGTAHNDDGLVWHVFDCSSQTE